MQKMRWLVVNHRWTSMALGAAIFILGFLAWVSVRESIKESEKSRFEKDVLETETLIEQRIKNHRNSLVHLRGLFEINPNLTVEQFSRYCDNMDFSRRMPGMHGVGYVEVIQASNLNRHEKKYKQIHGDTYIVNPPGKRSMYAPIVMLEPADSRKRRAIGFDMFSEGIRQRAMDKARDDGKPVMTHALNLMVENEWDPQPGFIIFLPVYSNPMQAITLEARRAGLRGFVYMVFRSRDFFEGLFGRPNPQLEQVNYSVSSVGDKKENQLYKRFEYEPLSDSLTTRKYIVLLNQKWLFKYSARDNFFTSFDEQVPFLVAVAALILCSLITVLFRLVGRYFEMEEENKKLMILSEQNLRTQSETFKKLNTVSKTILSQVNVSDILRQIVYLSRDLTHSDKAGVVTVENKDGETYMRLNSEVGIAADDLRLPEISSADFEKRLLHDNIITSQSLGSSVLAAKLFKKPEDFPNWMLASISDATGEVRAFVLVTRVTDEWFNEQAISLLDGLCAQAAVALQNAWLVQRADDANKAKSTFLANMSHEIRTPLGAIVGFCEMLVNSTLTSLQRGQILQSIKKNVMQLSHIIDDILDLSKVEAGKLRIERVQIKLVSVLHEVKSVMDLRARKKHLRFYVETEGLVPEVFVTDEIRLKQILMNLVGNAIKFTDHGFVRLIAKYNERDLPDAKKMKYMEFIVADTGRGISEKAQKQLFQPFFQTDESTTRRFGGTGLGLALSRRLARELGGDIVLVESKVGEGSKFLVRVACGDLTGVNWESSITASFAEPAQEPFETVVALNVVRNQNLVGKKVLLVEDSEDNQEIFRFFLESAGAQVTVVDNGLEAVQIARKENYDLILMDIQIPGIDGKQATQKLRSSGFQNPILALTAHAMSEERESCLQAGCNGQITKPVTGLDLINEIGHYLGGEPMQ